MPMPTGLQKLGNGHYIYKGWEIRQLTNNRWRGTKAGHEAVTMGCLKDVCGGIRFKERIEEEEK